MQYSDDQAQFGPFSVRLEHHDAETCMLRIRKERNQHIRQRRSCLFDLAIVAKLWVFQAQLVTSPSSSQGTSADTIVFVRLTGDQKSAVHQSSEQLIQVAKQYLCIMVKCFTGSGTESGVG